MRQQRRRPALSLPPMHKTTQELPKTGYALVVDGRLKTECETKEGAQKGAEDLKRRFPMLQVRVFDAQAQRSEDVVLA